MDVLVHSPRYNTPLAEFGIDKPFALDRGTRVLEKLQFDGRWPINAIEPVPISKEQALLVHTKRYIESLADPKVWESIFELKPTEYFPERAIRPLNALFDDIAFKSGGTLLAARKALDYGLAANLGGGYHHAFPDEGRGFCVIHDIAVAIRCLQQESLIRKAMIIDVDFHQGDGSAVVFSGDSSVYTLSIHSEEGWPEEKQKSDLDIPVYANEQHLYVDKLKSAVETAFSQFAPDFVVYVAGSDPYALDVLPGTCFLKLSLQQLKDRDEYVLETLAQRGIPTAMVFAGGYGPHVWEVHYQAVKRLIELAHKID